MTSPDQSRPPAPVEVDWVAAYNDLRWLLTLERAVVVLGLPRPCATLLRDLYGERVVRD